MEIYTKCHQGNVILIKNNSIKNYISHDFLNQSLIKFLKNGSTFKQSTQHAEHPPVSRRQSAKHW